MIFLDVGHSAEHKGSLDVDPVPLCLLVFIVVLIVIIVVVVVVFIIAVMRSRVEGG